MAKKRKRDPFHAAHEPDCMDSGESVDAYAGTEVSFVDRVRKIGTGLSCDVFLGEIIVEDRIEKLAVQLPRKGAPAVSVEAKRQELRLLSYLADLDLPFRVPRPLALLPGEHGPILIREFLAGVPADLRAGRSRCRPWELVASISGALHAIEVDALEGVTGHRSRRAHGEAQVQSLADTAESQGGFDPDVVNRSLAWLADNLPEDRPSRLLHGDLLGQNLLVWPDAAPGVIDWERACIGDPAYDLAIVTRGVRKPFQLADGFDRLLEAYATHGLEPIQPRDVRFHELCLLLRWYLEAPGDGVRQHNEGRIKGLLARVAS